METLKAGDGLLVSVGASRTPLWVYDAIGFGVDFDVGLKYGSISASNGGVSLLREPLILSGHVLFAVAPRWSILVRLGVENDFNPTLSSSGSVELGPLRLSSDWGGMVEVGPISSQGRGAASAPRCGPPPSRTNTVSSAARQAASASCCQATTNS